MGGWRHCIAACIIDLVYFEAHRCLIGVVVLVLLLCWVLLLAWPRVCCLLLRVYRWEEGNMECVRLLPLSIQGCDVEAVILHIHLPTKMAGVMSPLQSSVST